MLILALDTTTRASSCAVARDGVVICEEAGDASQPQAVRLPRELKSVLDHAGAALHEVDVFAVATGPGSFTGLRIGIASMQGLAFAASKPLIGVTGLDALAVIARAMPVAGDRLHVAVWMDAWRGDVYAALYEDGRPVGEPVVARPRDVLKALAAQTDGVPMLFVGDGAAAYRDLILGTLGDRARLASPEAPLLAGTIAQLAADLHGAGHRPRPHAIQPFYVRRPDAELAREGGQTRRLPAPTVEQ